MNKQSTNNWWQVRIKNSGDDLSSWREFLQDVLWPLTSALSDTALKANFITPSEAEQLMDNLDDNEFKEWQMGVKAGVEKGDWSQLAAHCTLSVLSEGLTTAYKTPFYLERTDDEVRTSMKDIYAKAIAVVQSSGTGKSRMLTETGRQIFTLPICLRKADDPGYPPSDLEVVKYYATLSKDNDFSRSAHVAFACFLAVAHTTMLEWLQKAQNENKFNGSELLTHWHELMEPQGPLVQRANSASHSISFLWNYHVTHKSPRRTETGDLEPMVPDASTFAALSYGSDAKKVTEDLPRALCVTYFDEAHESDLCFWVLLRLLQYQESSTRMWYVFMGTKSSLSYYAPRPANPRTCRMGDFQSIMHLSQYGRPLWRAQLPEDQSGEVIRLASFKLINGWLFLAKDRHHVFAVLSQRLCLDPVLTGSEAIQLADRSVAHHMRLLTGFSDNSKIFYTHSPSEPILVLGSVDILYNTLDAKHLGNVLHTLSHDLCSAGLVEKGVLGELGARTLLLVARDFTAPTENGRRNLLEPVRLLDFLHTLFGNNVWVGTNQGKFDAARLLANLWARGAALQCCFTQEGIDLLILTYTGSIEANAVFDPSWLSAAVVQVKFKAAGDKKASSKMRPLGIPRDLHQPLPYLALLMELGNESNYRENHSKIISMACKPVVDSEFEELFSHFAAAVKTLHSHRNQERGKKAKNAKETKKRKGRKSIWLWIPTTDTRSVRGASPDVYQIIKKADIVQEFATLLDITMPSPSNEDYTMQHMRPLDRLGVASNHTAWMTEYIVQG
ncbi:hypothetical protein BU17DRAFT_76734 [Hysterangium stoloniferum]|nr:hypothetical protein BU17DRAFT_76734 [Hysterangium stoloniferum]